MKARSAHELTRQGTYPTYPLGGSSLGARRWVNTPRSLAAILIGVPVSFSEDGRRTTYSRGWILADLNDDGAVNSADNDIETGVSNTTDPAHRADVNSAGVCHVSDFALIAAASGQSIAAAEPTVMHPSFGAGVSITSACQTISPNAPESHHDPRTAAHPAA